MGVPDRRPWGSSLEAGLSPVPPLAGAGLAEPFPQDADPRCTRAGVGRAHEENEAHMIISLSLGRDAERTREGSQGRTAVGPCGPRPAQAIASIGDPP